MTQPGRGRTIGQVLHLLRPDFPDISISKIRFLEAEGLVTPDRTPSGYRTFSDDDVARLRYVLAAQRDRFWPLKVIREALDKMDRGLLEEGPTAAPSVPPVAEDPSVPGPDDLRHHSTLRLTADELRQAAGLDASTFDALVTFGLLRARADGHFTEADLVVATRAAVLAGYGIEPRHLRPFRLAADRELGLVSAATPRTRTPEEHEQAQAQLMADCLALHIALVRAGMAQD